MRAVSTPSLHTHSSRPRFTVCVSEKHRSKRKWVLLASWPRVWTLSPSRTFFDFLLLWALLPSPACQDGAPLGAGLHQSRHAVSAGT